MVTVKITDQDVKRFFEERPALSKKPFCKQYGIPYDSFNAFLKGDPRYKTLSYQRLQEVLPGMFHYGFKLPAVEIEDTKTEEEIFLSEGQ